MEKTMMMLVNPMAGRALNNASLGSAVKAFCEEGWHPTVVFTDAPGSAKRLAAEYGGEFDFLTCLGGDGTLSDVLGGLMSLPREVRPKLGYIPMGTANDVATTLGLPMRQPADAAKKFLNGSELEYDVGELVGLGYFSYIAAFGAFTEVSYKTDQELKHVLGHAAYVIAGIQSLTTIKSCHAVVEHDGGTLEGDFIYGAVSNALSVGGMVKMNKELVDLSDGRFELLLVHKPTQPGDLNAIVGGIINQDYDIPQLTVLQSSHVSFTFDEPIAWTRDGEDGGKHQTVSLVCHPRAVTILR